MVFKNEDELKKAILKDLLVSSKKVGEKNTEILKNHVDIDMYDVGKPEDYNRTFGLRESSTTDVNLEGNTIKMTTYNDLGKTISSKDYPRAYSFGEYSPTDYRPYLVETIVEGTSGDLFGSTGFWHQKRDFISPTRDEIERTVGENIKSELRKKGIQIK